MSSKTTQPRSTYATAVMQALFVTFLWSTSWVLIKFGLADIPALTFAGLRYMLAFLCLVPFFIRRQGHQSLPRFSLATWGKLLGLGILLALTQGAQFVGLAYLPAVTLNIMLSFTAVVVALIGVFSLQERPAKRQWYGMGIALAGTLIYFYPIDIPDALLIGFIAGIVGLLANAGSALTGRRINREGSLPPLTVTVISMGCGATLMLAFGLLIQGLPSLSLTSWLIIGWLALVNTAFAFTLWNHTLRTLTAVESSVINNTMAIQIPILAIIFLGEHLTWWEFAGLVIAAGGILLVQIGRRS